MPDDPELAEWKRQLKEHQERLAELQGATVTPKGEDEEKAEFEHQTDNLAQKAEAAERLALKEKYEQKIAIMKNGLENGNMNEEDTVFVRTALAKFEKKLADLML